MIKLAVFDIAGTTVRDDDGVRRAFHTALQSENIPASDGEISRVMGLPEPEAIRQLLTQAGYEALSENVHRIHQIFVHKMQEYYTHHAEVAEIPGASQIFAQLRSAGIKVALNTGFSRDITDVLLRRLGWTVPAVIDATICSDEVERGRPYPDMIQNLLQRFSLKDASEVAKVGDTWADLEEGTQAGCHLVIGVTTGTFSREQLVQRTHTHIVDSIRDVPALILAS